MDIKNFYLLLELPADPPEEDPEVIEKAIRAKQSEWSRYRNHPTKSTLAQQYIGLIPDIRTVMSDDRLRKKEAKKARKILRDRERERFSRIDRHITLLMSKGVVSKQELSLLAKFHGVKPDMIRKRLKQKAVFFKISRQTDQLIRSGKCADKNLSKLARSHRISAEKLRKLCDKKLRDRDAEVENYLSRCAQRGYVTNEEIALLNRLYGVRESALLKRLRCPVRPKEDTGTLRPAPIDKTLEKLISDKLRLVGKTSLYDFLGIPPESDLDALMQRALDKESEVRRIGQKDAITTASGALAGHCLTNFKSEESRKAYDLSLVRSRLGEISDPLEVAGLSGRVWPEYVDILVRQAVGLGMDIEDACEYIESYCLGKNWHIEKKVIAPEKRRFRRIVAAAAVAGILLLIGIFFAVQHFQEVRIRNAWQKALTEAERQETPEAREVILKNFVKYHEAGAYTAAAEKKIAGIRKEIEERDFELTKQHAGGAVAAGDFEKAAALYRDYLSDYPATPHQQAIGEHLTDIGEKIDDRDFNALKSVARRDYDRQIEAYAVYFDSHPRGKHLEEAREIISATVDRYFDALKKALSSCEKSEDWGGCVAHCDAFLAKFGGTEQAKAAEGLRGKYKNKIVSHADLIRMKQEATRQGTDYEAARLIYLEYLEANPELPSSLKKLIVKEVRILDERIDRQKQAAQEWEKVLAYGQEHQAPLSGRIRKTEAFIAKYPEDIHSAEAVTLLAQLSKEKALEDDRKRIETENETWRQLVGYSTDSRHPLGERIRRTEQYLSENANGKYSQKAGAILDKLRQQKRIQDERSRQQQALKLRIQQEERRIRGVIGGSGGGALRTTGTAPSPTARPV
ncbi:hypothetical protein DENIS_3033 [Desulfonema ishimotonii]|uniref:Uncharacterized protein n=1 Tax=Desulfonema ishimotonii TaxID=45657 RepID=A0A401FYP4_9BACT|nr:hypothetical protein [Desulfonema ishimotonii]GBC62070.1 hypothetical protein DENIS_3033 [Desulfonema ishimotonii]